MVWLLLIALSCQQEPNTRVHLTSDQGELPSLLQEQQSKATRREQKPFVFLFATTQPESLAMREQFDAPEIVKILEGTWLIELNVEEWGAQIERAGFKPQRLPALYAIDEDARPTNHSFIGTPWEEATPSLMVQPLQRFFQYSQAPLLPPTHPR